MAKSRVDKKRKTKQINFKKQNKTKMELSNKSNENVQPIYRKPTWNANDSFSISGQELESLTNFANQFRPIIGIVDRILTIGEIEGNIVNEYVNQDGSPADESNPMLETAKKEREAYISNTKKLMQEYTSSLKAMLEPLSEQMEMIEEMEDQKNQEEGKTLTKSIGLVDPNNEPIKNSQISIN